MKKSALTFALSLFTASAMASSTATLMLRGEVSRSLSIAVIADHLAGNLPLDVTQNGTRIAKLQEKSNSKTGYSVSVESANKGVLKRVNGNQKFPYSLAYDGTALDLTQLVEISHPAENAVAQLRDLTISYTGVPGDQMVAGEYSDTVTFTISAN